MMTEPPHKKEKRNHEKDNMIVEEEDVDPAGEEVSDVDEEVDYTDEEKVDMTGQKEGVTDDDEEEEEDVDLTCLEEDEESVNVVGYAKKLNKTGQEVEIPLDIDVSDISKDSKLEKDIKSSVQQQDVTHTSSDIYTEGMMIQNEVGTVFQTHRFDPVLIYFQYHGNIEIAKASHFLYINGSHSWFSICKNERMMKSLLHVDDTVHFDAVCKPHSSSDKKAKKHYVWLIRLMWKGPKPDVSLLNTDQKFVDQENYFDALIKKVDLQQKEDEELYKKMKYCSRITGKIEEIISDTHGIIKTDKENKIIFKKEDFICNGMKLRAEQSLKNELEAGANVVALIKEEKLEHESATYSFQVISIWKIDEPNQVQRVEVDAPACWFVVTLPPVYTFAKLFHSITYLKDQVGVIKEIHRPKGGIITLESDKEVWFHRRHLYINKERLGVTDILEDAVKVGDTIQFNSIFNQGQNYMNAEVPHIAVKAWKGEKPGKDVVGDILPAKVLKLHKPEATGIESGIMRIRGTGPYQGMKVAFHRKDTYFCGLSLEKADLAHLLRKGVPLYCTIEELPEIERGNVTHRATIAWYGNQYSPEFTEETFISNESGAQLLKNAGLDIDKFEKLISGKLEPLYMMPSEPLPQGYVTAHLVYLFPPKKDKRVACACFVLENGRNPRQKVTLHRRMLKVWGFSMSNADLSYVFNPDERIICWVWCAASEPDSYRIKNAWIGNQTPRTTDSHNLEEVGKDPEFNAWLSLHKLDMEKFRLLLRKKLPPVKQANTQSQSKGKQQSNVELHLNPVTNSKVKIHDIVDVILNSRSLSNQALKYIIQDKEVAHMAEFLSQGLTISIKNYRENQAKKDETFKRPLSSPLANQYDRSGVAIRAGNPFSVNTVTNPFAINTADFSATTDSFGYHDGGDIAHNQDNNSRAYIHAEGDHVHRKDIRKRIHNRERALKWHNRDKIKKAGDYGGGYGPQHPGGFEQRTSFYGDRETSYYPFGGDRIDYHMSSIRASQTDGSNRPWFDSIQDKNQPWRPESCYDEPYYKSSRMDEFKSHIIQREYGSSFSDYESADYY